MTPSSNVGISVRNRPSWKLCRSSHPDYQKLRLAWVNVANRDDDLPIEPRDPTGDEADAFEEPVGVGLGAVA